MLFRAGEVTPPKMLLRARQHVYSLRTGASATVLRDCTCSAASDLMVILWLSFLYCRMTGYD